MLRPCSDPVDIAHQGQLRVRACGCGALHLDLGPFTVRMERTAMGELRDLLHTALHRLALVQHHQSDVPSGPPRLHLVEPEAPAAR